MSVKELAKNMENGTKPTLPDMKPFVGPKPIAPPSQSIKNKFNSNDELKPAQQPLVISNSAIKEQLSNIKKKRIPPPRVPAAEDDKKEIPEFLRKSLKKPEERKPVTSETDLGNGEKCDKESVPSEISKANFPLPFEEKSVSEVKKPKPTPKPRSLSKLSNCDESLSKDKNDVDTKVPEKIESLIDDTTIVLPKKGPKPASCKLCGIPDGLDKWIAMIIKSKLNSSNKLPAINKISSTQLPAKESEPIDELYDDAEGVIETDEFYDDIGPVSVENSSGSSYNDADIETYDDLESTLSGGKNIANAVDNNDELYDDALGMDDNNNGSSNQIEKEEGTLKNNDVDKGPQLLQEAILADEDFQAEQIYEPIESSSEIISNLRHQHLSNSRSLGDLTEERKSKKEMEKTKQREEKRRQKEEKQRKKQEELERKREEKERKQFNLKLEGELTVLERHVTIRKYKGKGKELSVDDGQFVEIISKDNCPKGRWLGRNSEGRIGYIAWQLLGVDEDYSKELPTKKTISPETEETFYEIIGQEEPPPVPLTPRPGLPPNPSDTPDLEIYEIIG